MTTMRPVLLLLALFCSGSHQQCFSQNDAIQFVSKEDINAWISAQRNFSVSFFQLLNAYENGAQVAFSPVSIYEALMLSYFGASHETEQSLARILRLPYPENKGKIWRTYYTQSVIPRNKVPGYPLTVANRLYLSHRLRLRHCMDSKFKGDLELIDYETNPYAAQAYINNWVYHLTGGMITNLISETSSSTTATLVSAAYFKGLWEYEFDPSKTKPMPFSTQFGEEIMVDMMYTSGEHLFGYEPHIGAHLLLLPYEGNSVSMIVLLPDLDLDLMIESMNEETLEYVTDRRNYENTILDIYLPKFRYANYFRLSKILSGLGLGDMIAPYANFTGFTGNPDVHFKKLSHETVIKVDEEGTKSSAVKVSYFQPVLLSQIIFAVDRPFAYVVYDFVAKKFLVMGTYRYPLLEIEHA